MNSIETCQKPNSLLVDFQRSKKKLTEELTDMKKSIPVTKPHSFSLSRKKLLEQEVVLSKAKIRMMLLELRMRLKQVRHSTDVI